jgi:hypothetical protein
MMAKIKKFFNVMSFIFKEQPSGILVITILYSASAFHVFLAKENKVNNIYITLSILFLGILYGILATKITIKGFKEAYEDYEINLLKEIIE